MTPRGTDGPSRWVLLLVTALLLALGGCWREPWEQKTYVGAMWSDDDSAWLVFTTSREERFISGDWGGTQVRNQETEVGVYGRDGTELVSLLPRQHQSLLGDHRGHFLMRQAGYAVVWRSTAEPGVDRGRREIIWFDGRVNDLGQAPVVPSPDGGVIARYAQVECPADPPEGLCPVRVEFLDPWTLEDAFPAVTIDAFVEDGYAFYLLWSRPDAVVLVDGFGTHAVEIETTGAVRTDAPIPTCSYPSTSSGTYSADGSTVRVEMVGDRREFHVVPGEEPGYPDRCLPGE